MIRILFIALLSLFAQTNYGQIDSTFKAPPTLNISGFLDVFYLFDFNKPQTVQRQPFLFNHNRHNEFNLNLGLIEFELQHDKYRANLAIQTGTYANDNYVSEPGVLKNIFEANIGISLNKKNNLWLDAGILPSYIGFESAVSMDNPTLTRSLLAASSPFFMTGAMLSYEPNDKWQLGAIFSNGWQRIQRVEGNSLMSIGTQVNFQPNENITFNWSTFIGTDDPDDNRRMRYFNNFFGQFSLSEKFNLVAGFDLGHQQKEKDNSDYDSWFTYAVIGQMDLSNNWKTAIRLEHYNDKMGIIIPTNTQNGFQTTGVSMNFDYAPADYIAFRFEGRWLSSKDRIFETNTGQSKSNFFIGSSLAVKFGS